MGPLVGPAAGYAISLTGMTSWGICEFAGDFRALPSQLKSCGTSNDCGAL